MTEAQGPTVEDVVAGYVTLRNKKAQIMAEAEARTKKITERMQKLEAWLQMKMHVEGVNSFTTDAGTAYKLTTEKATVSDMDALLDFIKKNEAWHLLEKRVSKTGVRAYLDENQPLPPGVDWYASTAIGVRKPNER